MLGGLIGTLLRSIESIGSFLELSCKDFSDLAEGLFFTASRGWATGIFRLRADVLVGHLNDALDFLLQAFGQFKGIGLVAQPFKLLSLDRIGLGAGQ